MSYTWRFKTTGSAINPIGRNCFHGPMIDVERVMSRPFRFMTQLEFVRARLIPIIVDSTEIPVAMREITLRTLNSLLSPVFTRLLPRKDELQVLICSKRSCTDIETDLQNINYKYLEAVRLFPQVGVLKEQVALIDSALHSESPIVRVAGKSAVVLLASFIEMDTQNG